MNREICNARIGYLCASASGGFRWGYGAAVARQSNTLKVGRSTLPNLKTFFSLPILVEIFALCFQNVVTTFFSLIL